MIMKNINKKCLKKWIGCFWFFNHSLRWFLGVPPKDGFAFFETKLSESKKKKNVSQAVCGQSLKTIFWKSEKLPWEHYISKK
jgi:hypothetical protein